MTDTTTITVTEPEARALAVAANDVLLNGAPTNRVELEEAMAKCWTALARLTEEAPA